MATVLTAIVEEAAEIEETSISPSSGGVTVTVDPGFNDLDEFDLTARNTASSVDTFQHTIDDPDGANWVVLAIDQQSYDHNGRVDATVTFDGTEMVLGGTQRQFYFTIGGTSGVYYLVNEEGWPAGTYDVVVTLNGWPVGTNVAVITGYVHGTPEMLDTFIYGDNGAIGTPLWSVTPGGKPCVAVGFQLNTGSEDVLDGACAPGENFWPGTKPNGIYAGVAQEDWSEGFPRSDDRDISTGSSGVGKRRCLVLMADSATGRFPTDKITITEPVVASAYSDGITVTLE